MSSNVTRCRHTVDPVRRERNTERASQIDVEADADILEETDDGRRVWRCPHEAVKNEKCVFHSSDEEVKEISGEEFVAIIDGKRESLDGTGPRPTQFIDAEFGSLELTGTQLDSHAKLDLRHASFDSIEWENGKATTPVECRGIEVAGSVRFGETTFESDVNFNGAIFEGAVDFSGATFERKATFANAIFKERGERPDLMVKTAPEPISAQFSDAVFQGEADFAGIVVNGAAYYYRAEFADRANFEGVLIKDWAHFHDATFRGAANFSESTFEREVRFWTTPPSEPETGFQDTLTFEGPVDFSGTTFADSTGFIGRFEGTVDFSNTVFEYAAIIRCRFDAEVSFSGAMAKEELELSFIDMTLSELDLSNTEFPSDTVMNFPGSDFSNFDLSTVEDHLAGANFNEADLSDTDLTGLQLVNTSFRRANLRDATLRNADISRADFTKADLATVDVHLARNVNRAEFSHANFRNQDFRLVRLTADDPSIDPDLDIRDEIVRPSGPLRPSDEYRRTDFSEADFSDADLYNASFACADLSGAMFDGANCRFADFRDANLENASFIETDLRSAWLDGASIHEATFTDCDMDLSTTITNVDLYGTQRVRAGFLSSVARALRRPLRRLTPRSKRRDPSEEAQRPPPPCVDESDDADSNAPSHASASGEATGTVDDGQDDHIEEVVWQLEKKAWTHEAIHRQLIRSGRLRRALSDKHYLKEQNARIRKARLEKNRLRVLELYAMKYILLASEVPVFLLFLILAFGLIFIGPYLYLGGLRDTATTTLYTLDDIALPDIGRLFLFSLVTMLEGIYLVIKTPLDPLIPFDLFEPVGTIAQELVGVSNLEPIGTAARVQVAERAFGAFLIVPFSWLFVQRLRIYFGSTTSEEGIESGFLSWFLGK